MYTSEEDCKNCGITHAPSACRMNRVAFTENGDYIPQVTPTDFVHHCVPIEMEDQYLKAIGEEVVTRGIVTKDSDIAKWALVRIGLLPRFED